MREIALVETELVCIIVILVRLAIVVERCDGNTKLIDSCCVRLCQSDLKAVVAGLLDSGDAVCGIAGLDTDRIVSRIEAEVCE